MATTSNNVYRVAKWFGAFCGAVQKHNENCFYFKRGFHKLSNLQQYIDLATYMRVTLVTVNLIQGHSS